MTWPHARLQREGAARRADRNSSVCPSFACLDVKMYSFLNSQSCICTVGDLERLRDLGHEAVEHLRIALIGAPGGPTPKPSLNLLHTRHDSSARACLPPAACPPAPGCRAAAAAL